MNRVKAHCTKDAAGLYTMTQSAISVAIKNDPCLCHLLSRCMPQFSETGTYACCLTRGDMQAFVEKVYSHNFRYDAGTHSMFSYIINTFCCEMATCMFNMLKWANRMTINYRLTKWCIRTICNGSLADEMWQKLEGVEKLCTEADADNANNADAAAAASASAAHLDDSGSDEDKPKLDKDKDKEKGKLSKSGRSNKSSKSGESAKASDSGGKSDKAGGKPDEKRKSGGDRNEREATKKGGSGGSGGSGSSGTVNDADKEHSAGGSGGSTRVAAKS